MEKKTIAWITGSNFFDVDMQVIPHLAEKYEIYWIVIHQVDSFFLVTDIERIAKLTNIEYKIIELKHRLRSWRVGIQFWKLIKKVKLQKADLLYVNLLRFPYLFPLIWLSGIPQQTIIYACHDFKDHFGINNRKLFYIYKKFIFSCFENFHFFSLSQRNLFRKDYNNKKSFYAPLSLKDFGRPEIMMHTKNKTVFLFFGQIRKNKGLNILIKATNKLQKKCPNKFVVKIFGGCDDWSAYNSLIEDYTCYEIRIARVENKDIPNIFATTHYLVLPYLDVTQSGPLFISYNYGVPVIASNHPGFSEFVKDKENGFLFQDRDEDSLFEIMCDIIDGKYPYDKVKLNLKNYINRNLSIDNIKRMYCSGFDDILYKSKSLRHEK